MDTYTPNNSKAQALPSFLERNEETLRRWFPDQKQTQKTGVPNQQPKPKHEQRERVPEKDKFLTSLQELPKEAQTEAPEEEEKKNRLRRLLATQDGVFKRAQEQITFSAPLVRIDGMPFIYPNTIATISAKTGMHKSRLAEIIAASLLSKNQDPAKCLGLTTERECEVVLIDTERNLTEQLPYAIQCISRLAYGSAFDKPKNLYCTSVLEERREDRFSALSEFLEHRRENTPRHLVAIVDVLTDICVNFNDPRFSMPIIDMINKAINTEDCTFIVVIHQNPSKFDDKARGHLGTEIENKGSSNIVLTKNPNDEEDDRIAIKCKKQRSAKPFETIFVRFDESQKTLVRVEAQEEERLRATEEKRIEWEDVFGSDSSLSRTELVKRLVGMGHVKTKVTAERKISEALNYEDLAKGEGKRGQYSRPEAYPQTENLPYENALDS